MNKNTLALLLIGIGTFTGCGVPEPPKSEAPAAKVSHPAPTAEAPKPAVDVTTLALKIDPACKMSLEEYPVAATAEHGGKTYGFCSDFCKKKFLEAPDAMLARLAEAPATGDARP